MKIFLDTSKIDEMQKWSHIIDGVTTNPSILKKEGGNIEEICEYISPLPISVESGGDFYLEAMELWEWLHPLNKNLAIKVPFLKPNGKDNLQVITSLIEQGLTINCTAVLSLSQCILADKIGCKYISIFAGRIDDEGGDSMDVIDKAEDWISTHNIFIDSRKSEDLRVELIVGSLRSVKDVDRSIRALKISPYSILTIPPSILEKMTQHRYAQETSKQFEDDYVSVVFLKGLKDTQKSLEIPHPIVGN